MPSSSLSCLICFIATEQNAPFACSRTTSLQFWPALIPRFPLTFGTSSLHRLSSSSIFSTYRCLTQGSVRGNISKVPLTSTRCRSAQQLVVASSSMKTWQLNVPGISMQSKVSTFALPLSPTVASSWSMQTSRAKSSRIRSSFDISNSLSLRLLPPTIRSSKACKELQALSGEPHLPQVSPNLR
jgi:hypothetical protein